MEFNGFGDTRSLKNEHSIRTHTDRFGDQVQVPADQGLRDMGVRGLRWGAPPLHTPLKVGHRPAGTWQVAPSPVVSRPLPDCMHVFYLLKQTLFKDCAARAQAPHRRRGQAEDARKQTGARGDHTDPFGPKTLDCMGYLFR